MKNRMPYALMTAAYALFLLVLSQPTFAQMGGGVSGMGMGGPGGMSGMGGMGGPTSRPSSESSSDRTPRDHAQRQFSELEAKLALTDAQRPLWAKFADRLSAFNGDLARNPAGKATANDNAVQQINRKIDGLRNRVAALEEISDAARSVYVTLSPTQKKTADAMLAQTIPGLYDNFQPGGDGNRPGGQNGQSGRDGNGPPPPPR